MRGQRLVHGKRRYMSANEYLRFLLEVQNETNKKDEIND